jgi:hypothetical protein
MMTAVTELRAWPVDSRDTSWEVWHPHYRVYFWRSLEQGWASREFELSAADAVEVLAWAADHAEDDETFTVHCVVERAEGTGPVRLAGTDPTAHIAADLAPRRSVSRQRAGVARSGQLVRVSSHRPGFVCEHASRARTVGTPIATVLASNWEVVETDGSRAGVSRDG